MSNDRNRYRGSNHYTRSNRRRRTVSKTSGTWWKAIDKGVGMTASAIWHSSDAYQVFRSGSARLNTIRAEISGSAAV